MRAAERVLLVEDDAAILGVLEALRADGYAVVVASTGTLSVDQYLPLEKATNLKHEYVLGQVCPSLVRP